MSDYGFTITNLHRDPKHGYWTAQVNGQDVDRKSGSWQTTNQGTRQDVKQTIAFALQKRVRSIERAEHQDVEQSAVAAAA